MKKNSILVKSVLMSMLTAASFSFIACSDDVEIDNAPAALETESKGILGASADNFNINDLEFNAETWRDQEAIYLYDGEGRYDKDSLDREGYTKVNLPWLIGDVQSNLPNGFCNDITRANGWELVLNRCGSRSLKNNNFFAIYNKYTGILRFFFYMPEKFQTGNDHVWEVTMTDNMAKSTALRYGLPQKSSIVNKNKIGLSGETTISEYVAPWVGRLSSDGLITPNAGWWAFDVDLSIYSGKPLTSTDNIRLQMRSMQTGAISLNSQIAANIDGSVKADIDLLQSQHLGNSVTGIVSKLFNMGSNAYKVATAVQGEKWGEALSAAMSIGKTTANMCGIKTESSQDIQGTLDGTISLNMNGTIATQGIMESSQTTAGVVTPTFYMKDFDFTNAPGLGEGIWNLEEAPVVYYTNAKVTWENQKRIYTTDELTKGVGAVMTSDKKSPFGGQHTYIADISSQDKYSNEPYAGFICYFDPQSIKLKLNDKVFSSDEIKNAKVYATCGVRKSAAFGSTEDYREAMGLTSSSLTIDDPLDYINPSFTAAPFDAFSAQDDTLGMKRNAQFQIDKSSNRPYGLFGRGDNDYIVMPQALYGGKNVRDEFMMPAYEVNVTVVVEHNGEPIVYTRTYLPQYKAMNAERVPNTTFIIDPLEKKPANYVGDIYKQQMKQINNIRSFLFNSLQPIRATQLCYRAWTSWHWDDPNESAVNLIDGDTSTKWCSAKGCTNINVSHYIVANTASNRAFENPEQHVWAFEFRSNVGISPTRYTLVTASDNSVFPNRRPKAWALYGQTADGKWQLLDKKVNSNGSVYDLPKGNLQEQFYLINYEPGLLPKFYKFRFEVHSTYSNADADCMQLAEFRFGGI